MSHIQSRGAPSGPNRRKSIFTPNINNLNTNETTAQTIELERLEQEITLTLQTIDKSFAKSHKIINDRLIPIIKKYHSSSKKIWQGVSFWRNFLEASANVEFRGYEEAIQNQEFTDDQILESIQEQHEIASQSGGDTLQLNEQFSPVKTDGATGAIEGDSALMESTNTLQNDFQKRYTDNLQHHHQNDQVTASNFRSSTPNTFKNNPIMPTIRNQNNLGFDTTDSILPPIPVSANLSNTNGTDVNQTTPTLQRSNHTNEDFQEPRTYLLHQNLDTNYKVQISPRRKHPHQPAVNSFTPKKPPQKKRKSMYAEKFDSSPFEIETPKLQSDVQFSPVKSNKQLTPLKKNQQEQQEIDDNQTQRFPLTPRYGANGQLLHTSNQVSRTANRYSNHGFQHDEQNEQNQPIHTTLDDSEQMPNISPPVTLNFATTTIRKTPSRQAAQLIVKDVLSNVSGVNDSGLSGLEEFGKNVSIPQFNDSEQDSLFIEKEISVLAGQDFDDFLDKKYENKNEELDWSDDDDSNNNNKDQ